MLIKTIQEIQVVANISLATDIDTLSPHLAAAEITHIRQLLGADMYAALISYHADSSKYKITDPVDDIELTIVQGSGSGTGQVTAEEKAWALVLYLTQRSIAYLALWKGFDILNAYISDGGFRRQEGEKFKSLFKYQEDNIKNMLFETGFNTLDQILEFLETNISHFSAFKTQLQKYKSRIMPDTKTFSDHYNINNSHIVFERLRQHMKTVEDLTLTPVVGEANMALVFSELKKQDPAAKVLRILPYLRDCVAWFSTAMLMEESGTELTARGLYLKGVKSISNSDLVINADENRVKELIKRNYARGNEYIGRLEKYLRENSNDWDISASPRSAYLHNRDNSGKKTFFA